MELQAALPEYDRHGVALFAISYDSVDALATFSDVHGITYTLLSDPDSAVIDRLGLRNPTYAPDHQAHGVPYPGSFVLDEGGVIVGKQFDPNLRRRQTGIGLLEEAFGVETDLHGPEARAQDDVVAVRAHLDSPTYRPMQQLRLTVDIRIADGYHVYGQPLPSGYTPLRVSVDPIEGLEIGELRLPPASPFQFQGLADDFFVYEGTVKLSLPLTIREDIGDQQLAISVSFQACTSDDCRFPATLGIELPVRPLPLIGRR